MIELYILAGIITYGILGSLAIIIQDGKYWKGYREGRRDGYREARRKYLKEGNNAA